MHISLHVGCNMPDIYIFVYTAICRTYIVARRSGGNMPEQRIYVWDYCHFCFRCIFRQQFCPICHIIALLQYAKAPRIFCAVRLFWHSLNKFFCPNVCQVLQFTLIAQWPFVRLKITSILQTFFLKYKNPS